MYFYDDYISTENHSTVWMDNNTDRTNDINNDNITNATTYNDHGHGGDDKLLGKLYK